MTRGHLHLMESSPNIGSRLGRLSKSIRITHMNQTNSQISLSGFNSTLKEGGGEHLIEDQSVTSTHRLRLSSTKGPAWKPPSTFNTVRLNLNQSNSNSISVLAVSPAPLIVNGFRTVLRPSESVGSSLTTPLGASRSDLVAS